jgi:hypothetical protein
MKAARCAKTESMVSEASTISQPDKSSKHPINFNPTP